MLVPVILLLVCVSLQTVGLKSFARVRVRISSILLSETKGSSESTSFSYMGLARDACNANGESHLTSSSLNDIILHKTEIYERNHSLMEQRSKSEKKTYK